MKRDIIAALIIGFVIGGVIAITAVNLPNIVKNSFNTANTAALVSSTPIPKSPEILNLEVTSPADWYLSSDKTMEIKGRTKKGATVIMETETDTHIKEADDEGNFTDKIDLTDGSNTLIVTSVNENGENIQKILTVYYTSEKL